MTGPRDGVDVAEQSRLEDPSSVADLLLRISDGGPAAWDEILRRYGGLVAMTVRSFRLQEADALDAMQMTWLRLAENADRLQFPERLGGWLVTTARRECLYILHQVKPAPSLTEVVLDTAADSSAGPEQRVIEADTARMLRKLVDELPPRRRTLIRMLFNDDPRPYTAIAGVAGIPLGGIGPTRARALRQLRDLLGEYELGSEAGVAEDVKGEPTEGDRTGSYLLDDLLDNAEQALREKLEPTVTDLRTGSSQGTADAHLDELMHRADAALRAALRDHETTVSGFLTADANDPDNRIVSLPADRWQEATRAQIDAIVYKAGDAADAIFGRVGDGTCLGLELSAKKRQLTLVSDDRSVWRALGPVEVVVAGQVVDLGPPRQRALFGLLLSRADRPVALDALIEQLWAGNPPALAATSLRAYVSNLRRVLEPDRPPRAPATVLRTRAPGYLLDSQGVEFDVHQFTRHATAGREALDRADPEQALDEFDAALGLWRGQAYADLRDAEWAAPEISRLEELRLSVVEARCAAQLELGDHDAVVAELDLHLRAHPLREHVCELLALAQYRAGRQAEALGVLRDTRARLAEELGIDPGAALVQLERDILAQAPTLDWHPPRPTPGASVAEEAASPPPNVVLSARELEVLHLTALASSNAQIGWRLAITDGTVKRHLTNIYAELGRSHGSMRSGRRPLPA